MICRNDHDIIISSSLCDFTGRLGIPQCFDLLMDAATRHADELGVGRYAMKEMDLFWMITKTRIKIFSMPKMSDVVTIRTWPCPPQRIHGDRCYTIEKDGELLVSAKTEWVNYNFVTGKLSPVSDRFAEGTEFSDEDTFPEGFDRIGGEFPEMVCEYKVRTSDVDVNRHVNNTKYVYALLDIFTTKDLTEHPVKQIEVIYKNQAREGDTLVIFRRVNEDGTEDYKITAGGSTVIFARLERG